MGKLKNLNQSNFFFFVVIFILASSDPSLSLNVKRYVLAKHSLDNDYKEDLTRGSLSKNQDVSDADPGYLLTLLSDEEIIQLLRDEPLKNERSVNDDGKTVSHLQTYNNQHLESSNSNPSAQSAYFRLDDKTVDPYSTNNGNLEKNEEVESHFKNILYSNPKFNSDESDNDNEAEDRKKETLFNKLVAQLKELCCEKKETFKRHPKKYYRQETTKKENTLDTEHIFLVLNDEIKNQSDGELIAVDPNSLSENSSIVLLGSLMEPMPDDNLLQVMKSVGDELSQDKYTALLNNLSKGIDVYESVNVMKRVLSGPTRRYIKPHRCNHQSKLAKVYGGPKWLICTGYININTPSLYD